MLETSAALPTTQSQPAIKLGLDHILRMGNIFSLGFPLDIHKIEKEIQPFASEWKQYNPYKPEIRRRGLSITSLHGGLDGKPDLYSLSEYHRREGVLYRESDFRAPTPVYEACTGIHPVLNIFKGHLGRTHFLRFGAGGYFPPHRDAAGMLEPDTFRILVPLHNAYRENYTFLYAGQVAHLEAGCIYFINTLVEHAVFSFMEDVTLLVCNVIVSHESVLRLKQHMSFR